MRKILSWIAGFAFGAGVAALVVMIFVPQTSAEIRQRLRDGYEEALEEARKASEQRRAELEASLAEMQKRPQPQNGKR